MLSLAQSSEGAKLSAQQKRGTRIRGKDATQLQYLSSQPRNSPVHLDKKWDEGRAKIREGPKEESMGTSGYQVPICRTYHRSYDRLGSTGIADIADIPGIPGNAETRERISEGFFDDGGG